MYQINFINHDIDWILFLYYKISYFLKLKNRKNFELILFKISQKRIIMSKNDDYKGDENDDDLKIKEITKVIKLKFNLFEINVYSKVI